MCRTGKRPPELLISLEPRVPVASQRGRPDNREVGHAPQPLDVLWRPNTETNRHGHLGIGPDSLHQRADARR